MKDGNTEDCRYLCHGFSFMKPVKRGYKVMKMGMKTNIKEHSKDLFLKYRSSEFISFCLYLYRDFFSLKK